MKLAVHWTKWSPWEYGRTDRRRTRELRSGRWQGVRLAVLHEQETWGDHFFGQGRHFGLEFGQRTNGWKLYPTEARALAPLRKVLKVA